MGERGRPPAPLDLTVLSEQFGHDVYNVTVTPREHPEERTEAEKTEAEHRRRIFWVVFAIVILAGAATFAVIVSGRPADAETQAWARRRIGHHLRHRGVFQRKRVQTAAIANDASSLIRSACARPANAIRFHFLSRCSRMLNGCCPSSWATQS